MKFTAETLKDAAFEALDDLKGKDIVTLDVKGLTSVTDYMLVCTGSSNRHVKSLADNVYTELKKQGLQALSVEGDSGSEWVLVDFGDVVVHVMLEEARNFYELEKLWSVPA
ncbi:ribosome silencing factor [Dasania sp. GY-MA-18]|uniref:Ribosomal silencing factor RsfS n=1 Tax=Dasania phycosphaerae TaxID=2950436 RepID=A0A9J6RH38_9GAMM|nr:MULTISPECIES: ribosome silencing factor [Dasania]MCR8921213.1 ribosome silencing factor [Dasania sp. GY-MA-18]MCZ0863641.1 ribosome silencing factor [Dasania phycosphaerae]MCZ0867369.1 ribosome silencing factor [Dasania phycosphaerae]